MQLGAFFRAGVAAGQCRVGAGDRRGGFGLGAAGAFDRFGGVGAGNLGADERALRVLYDVDATFAEGTGDRGVELEVQAAANVVLADDAIVHAGDAAACDPQLLAGAGMRFLHGGNGAGR